MAQAVFEGDLNQFNPNNPFAGDERIPVQFYMGAVQNDSKTTEAGRPIFDDVECIRIFNSKDNIVDRPVRDMDKQRWPRQYSAWKAGDQEAGLSGTRLDQWGVLTRAQAEEFKYFKIFTVEQLAEAPDSSSHNFMGFQKYKALAKAYIEMSRGQAPILKLQEQLEQANGTIASQKDQLDKMAERLERLEKAAKK